MKATVNRASETLRKSTSELFESMEPWRKSLVRWHVEHGTELSTAVSHVYIMGFDAIECAVNADYPTRAELGLPQPKRTYEAYAYDAEWNERSVKFESAARSAAFVAKRAAQLFAEKHGDLNGEELHIRSGNYRLTDLVADRMLEK